MFRASKDPAVKQEVKEYYTSLLSLFQEFVRGIHENNPTTVSAENALKIYDDIRDTEIYRTIKNLIINKKDCSQAEYLFYALVTDDVSQLNPNRLNQNHQIDIQITVPTNVNFHDPIKAFAQNLDDLAAALRFQKSPSKETFLAFQDRLYERTQLTLPHLNLSGLQIPEIPKLEESYNHTMLRFLRCLLVNTTFMGEEYKIYAIESIFSNTYFSNTKLLYNSRFESCDFYSLSFSAETINHISFVQCRFSIAELRTPQLNHASFRDCTFNSSLLWAERTTSTQINGRKNNIVLEQCNINDSTLNFGNVILLLRETSHNFEVQNCVINQSKIHFGRIDGVSVHWGANKITDTTITTHSLTNADHFIVSIGNDNYHGVDLRHSLFKIDTLLRFKYFQPQGLSDTCLYFEMADFSDLPSFNTFLCVLNEMINRWKLVPIYDNVALRLSNLAILVRDHIVAYHENHPETQAELLQAALNHAAFKHRNTGGLAGSAGYLFGSLSPIASARKILDDALNAVNAPDDVENPSRTFEV